MNAARLQRAGAFEGGDRRVVCPRPSPARRARELRGAGVRSVSICCRSRIASARALAHANVASASSRQAVRHLATTCSSSGSGAVPVLRRARSAGQVGAHVRRLGAIAAARWKRPAPARRGRATSARSRAAAPHRGCTDPSPRICSSSGIASAYSPATNSPDALSIDGEQRRHVGRPRRVLAHDRRRAVALT